MPVVGIGKAQLLLPAPRVPAGRLSRMAVSGMHRGRPPASRGPLESPAGHEERRGPGNKISVREKHAVRTAIRKATMAMPASRRAVLKGAGASAAMLGAGGMLGPVSYALAQDSQGKKILRTNTTTEIYAWDPHIHGGTSGMTALRHIFDRLVVREGTKLVGQLATGWELIDDLTWEFKLRDDVYFHDGHQLTAEDVKASLDRLTEFKDQYLYPFWDDYDSAEVVDDFTVRIKTATLKADMLPSLEVLVIGPAHLMGDPSYKDTMIGSGPFKFVEFRPGEVLCMEANLDYWGGAPEIDGIEFYEIPETSSRVTALLAGDLHIVSALEPDSIPVVESSGSARVLSVPSWVRDLAFFNHHLEKYQDLRVREALWLAIDTQEIVDSLFPPGFARVMRSTVSSQALDFKDLGPYPHDPEQARALL